MVVVPNTDAVTLLNGAISLYVQSLGPSQTMTRSCNSVAYAGNHTGVGLLSMFVLLIQSFSSHLLANPDWSDPIARSYGG